MVRAYVALEKLLIEADDLRHEKKWEVTSDDLRDVMDVLWKKLDDDEISYLNGRT